MIWHKPYSIQDWKKGEENTIHQSLGIELLEITNRTVRGRMPIDKRTHQPMGILHGGASVVLAESLGSFASAMIVDPTLFYVVGQTITASHIRPGISGWATGEATPIHIGSRSHIWNIDIVNDDHKLICSCRLTMAVVEKPKS